MKLAISGGAVVAAAGIIAAGVGVFAMRKSVGETVGKVTTALNPTSPDNIFHKAAEPVITKPIYGTPAVDYLFAGADLLNPFNESDVYARQVFFGWLDRDG